MPRLNLLKFQLNGKAKAGGTGAAENEGKERTVIKR